MSSSLQQLLEELRRFGVKNEHVLRVIGSVPRDKFVEEDYLLEAYEDTALPIACGQTISQPYIVAIMTERLLLNHPQKVLEIGTGSGYQAAILSLLVKEVYSIERIQQLQEKAAKRLSDLHYNNVTVIYGDGKLGHPLKAPYDGILVTAATSEVPKALLEQLAEGGQLILPLGEQKHQELTVITRKGNDFFTEVIESVVFVPLLSGKI